MSTSPREALDRLVLALENHFAAASGRRGESDPVVTAAYQTLADAFEVYDDALYDTFDEVTPFVLVESDELEDDDLDDEDLEDDDLEDDEDDEDDDDEDDLDDEEEELDGSVPAR